MLRPGFSFAPMIIAHHRLLQQQLTGTACTTPREIVRWLGAVQAQDYPMSKWAIGVRLPGSTEAAIEDALNRGEIVRTHLMRPTWHLVAAEDLRWLLALTAPHVKAAIASMDRLLGLDVATITRSQRLIGALLAKGHHLTRPELMAELAKAGFATHENRPAHLMYHAELEGLVCNGVQRGRHHTYALVDERIPSTPSLSRDEARAELARRYFLSHGPATVHDFAWWSGLPMADARAGLEAAKHLLVAEPVGTQILWHPPTTSSSPTHSLHLLPCFDEYTVSYKDRSAVIRPHHAPFAMTNNGIFRPIIVVDGQVVGIWKRTLSKNKLLLEPTFFENWDPAQEAALRVAAERYGQFLGATAVEVVF
jgi:Winged helix DNA-binding domain